VLCVKKNETILYLSFLVVSMKTGEIWYSFLCDLEQAKLLHIFIVIVVAVVVAEVLCLHINKNELVYLLLWKYPHHIDYILIERRWHQV
jgi:hypothetical protein